MGQNVQRSRADRFSQTELAKKMRDRGWKWTQPTVVAVESGERPLKIGEVIDLAAILRTSVTDLIETADASLRVAEQSRQLAVSNSRLRGAMRSYNEDRAYLALKMDEAADGQMDEQVTTMAQYWIDLPVRAVAAYIEREAIEADGADSEAAVGYWTSRLREVDRGERQAEV